MGIRRDAPCSSQGPVSMMFEWGENARTEEEDGQRGLRSHPALPASDGAHDLDKNTLTGVIER